MERTVALSLLAAACLAVDFASADSDFYAYYTRLDYTNRRLESGLDKDAAYA